jgi:paired amphipathic helix protein Sin3a
VKRVLDNRDLYNEFLKLVNLFAQDYIDTARLVKESRNFLGNTELYVQFRDILGWDEKKEREHFLAEQHTQSSWTKPAVAGLPERPGRIDFSEKYGSYRKVSARVSDIYIFNHY